MHITTDSVKESRRIDANALKVAERYRNLGDSGPDPREWAAALSLCIKAAADGRIPAGVLLKTEIGSFESRWSRSSDDPPATGRPLTSIEGLAIEQTTLSYTV